VLGIKRKKDASFCLDGKNEREFQRGEGISREERELGDGSQQEIYPTTPPPPPTARRRKGIPQRAPFGS